MDGKKETRNKSVNILLEKKMYTTYSSVVVVGTSSYSTKRTVLRDPRMRMGLRPQRSESAPNTGTKINAISVERVEDIVDKTWAPSATTR